MKGDWVYVDFDDWYEKFSNNVLTTYFNIVDLTPEEKGDVLQSITDNKKKIQKDVFKLLLGSMRNTIKAHHNLK